MIRKKDNLLINRGINLLNFRLIDIINDNNNFINSMNLIAQNSILPINSPFEAHPYSHLMNYNNEYEIFIMGTFPPISYLYDTCLNIINLRKEVQGRKIPKSQFPFFHGNKNLMWDYFLTTIEKNNLNMDDSGIEALLNKDDSMEKQAEEKKKKQLNPHFIDISNLKDNILLNVPGEWISGSYNAAIVEPIFLDNFSNTKLIKKGFRSLIKDPSILFNKQKRTIK